ncbi:MAG: right-handed parallel beta-helix repeat-containing protein [Alphaproteobacteria bacterium]|nr:right-handed parallel beta-helix repeat-containing protein [Alphaproteobacteria bacterium]
MATYNVQAFGANPNDGVDDTDIIQSLIDRASSEGGGTVFLPGGTYTISGTGVASKGAIQLKDNVTVQGAGMGQTVLRLADGSSSDNFGLVRTVSGDVNVNITLSDLTIDGNRENTSGKVYGFFSGVRPLGSEADEDITVLRVEVKNCSYYGFDPHAQTHRLTIADSVAHHNATDGFVADYVVNGTFENDTSYGNDRHGFQLVTNTHDFIVDGVVSYGNGSNGGVAQRGSQNIPWTHDAIVLGSQFFSNGSEGFVARLTDNLSLLGNHFYENARQGIELQGAVGSTVWGNILHNNGNARNGVYDEIYLNGYQDGEATNAFYVSKGNYIAYNQILADGSNRAAYGVAETADGASGNTVNSNTVAGTVYGALDLKGGGAQVDGPTGRTMLSGDIYNNTLYGADGSDVIGGGGGDDMLSGFGGVDTMIGGGGRDVIYAGFAEDSLWGGTGDDFLAGEAGNDTFEGGIGNDVAWGGEGNDKDSGWAGDDVSYGEAGNDTLAGNAGNDSLLGGGDGDHLFGNIGSDSLNGEAGADQVFGGKAADAVYGSGGDDSLFGNIGLDTLAGGIGDDFLHGGQGDDQISGDAGNDTLAGGVGNATVSGGEGSDRFLFLTPGDKVITDFAQGTDIIGLSSYIPELGNMSVDRALSMVTYTEGNAYIGRDEAELVLLGVDNITASDFVLV